MQHLIGLFVAYTATGDHRGAFHHYLKHKAVNLICVLHTAFIQYNQIR